MHIINQPVSIFKLNSTKRYIFIHPVHEILAPYTLTFPGISMGIDNAGFIELNQYVQLFQPTLQGFKTLGGFRCPLLASKPPCITLLP